MTPSKARFDFFKLHFQDAKKTFTAYHRNVIDSLAVREESVKIVYNVASAKGMVMLDEMTRDIRIFRSRVEKVNTKLADLIQLVRRSYTDEAADEAVASFFVWRDLREDFCSNFALTIKKWKGFEKEIYVHFQT